MAKQRKKKRKTKRKPLKRGRRIIKSSKGEVDGIESSSWLFLTAVYSLFVAWLSGKVKTELPEIVYIWGEPLDIQQGVFVFGLALWGTLSMLINYFFKKR